MGLSRRSTSGRHALLLGLPATLLPAPPTTLPPPLPAMSSMVAHQMKFCQVSGQVGRGAWALVLKHRSKSGGMPQNVMHLRSGVAHGPRGGADDEGRRPIVKGDGRSRAGAEETDRRVRTADCTGTADERTASEGIRRWPTREFNRSEEVPAPSMSDAVDAAQPPCPTSGLAGRGVLSCMPTKHRDADGAPLQPSTLAFAVPKILGAEGNVKPTRSEKLQKTISP